MISVAFEPLNDMVLMLHKSVVLTVKLLCLLFVLVLPCEYLMYNRILLVNKIM